MASAMLHTLQSCQNLCTVTQAQMLDEDKCDPLPTKTVEQLEEVMVNLRKSKEVLRREATMFSHNADFSEYTDRELAAMTAFVKESSRVLSILLAGGVQHFYTGQGMGMVQELKNMSTFIDGKVKEFLNFPEFVDAIEVKARTGRYETKQRVVGTMTNHPDMCFFHDLEAGRGNTSQESLEILGSLLEMLAGQCRTVAETRGAKLTARARKVQVHEAIKQEAESLLPMLRLHVLRVGMGKTTLRDGTGLASGGQLEKITNTFTFQVVQQAHRSLENTRERLLQESLVRKFQRESLASAVELDSPQLTLASPSPEQTFRPTELSPTTPGGPGSGPKGRGRGRGRDEGEGMLRPNTNHALGTKRSSRGTGRGGRPYPNVA